MKEPVFTDTGFWIALFDRYDRMHSIAKNGLVRLLQQYRVFLSDFIIFETITYLNCSLKRHDLAIRFLEKIRASSLTSLIVDEGIKAEALTWFEKYSDKQLSMTDCTSFVLMTRNGIDKYAGFDDHFNQMKFVNALPEK